VFTVSIYGVYGFHIRYVRSIHTYIRYIYVHIVYTYMVYTLYMHIHRIGIQIIGIIYGFLDPIYIENPILCHTSHSIYYKPYRVTYDIYIINPKLNIVPAPATAPRGCGG
jgi:hypothetical protein